MNRLHPLLSKYDTILLDLDGVITSEEVYWNTAALTVWEFINSNRYYGAEAIDPAFAMEILPSIRDAVFCHDAVIKTVKNRGINNNWDLAWFVIAGFLVLKTQDFESVHKWLLTLPETAAEFCGAVAEALEEKAGLPEREAAHQGLLWHRVQLAFQEWFLGSELFPKHWDSPVLQPDKPGLTFGEEPLVNKEKLLTLLRLIAREKTLGIGTGRPRIEMLNPLKRWGAYDYFAPASVVTHHEVQAAQKTLRKSMPELILTKPHPYIFLKAIFGNTVADEDLIAENYDKDHCKKTLVIGDAGCDLFAAKAAGCDFLAVLTGISGEGARAYFLQEGADYILGNILELLES